MKRFLAILLALCAICSTAFGETILERVKAPETVTLPVEEHGTLFSIAFDAKVMVPDVEKAPVLQVKIDEITEDRIFAAADVLGIEDTNRSASAWDKDALWSGGETKRYSGYESGWRQFYSSTDYGYEKDPQTVTYSALYSNEFKKAEYYIGQLQVSPYPQTPREGTMTRNKAYALAQAMMWW